MIGSEILVILQRSGCSFHELRNANFDFPIAQFDLNSKTVAICQLILTQKRVNANKYTCTNSLSLLKMQSIRQPA